jgi:hypothetical protein
MKTVKIRIVLCYRRVRYIGTRVLYAIPFDDFCWSWPMKCCMPPNRKSMLPTNNFWMRSWRQGVIESSGSTWAWEMWSGYWRAERTRIAKSWNVKIPSTPAWYRMPKYWIIYIPCFCGHRSASGRSMNIRPIRTVASPNDQIQAVYAWYHVVHCFIHQSAGVKVYSFSFIKVITKRSVNFMWYSDGYVWISTAGCHAIRYI